MKNRSFGIAFNENIDRTVYVPEYDAYGNERLVRTSKDRIENGIPFVPEIKATTLPSASPVRAEKGKIFTETYSDELTDKNHEVVDQAKMTISIPNQEAQKEMKISPVVVLGVLGAFLLFRGK